MLQHTMGSKAIAGYIESVQAIFPFDTMGFGNFVRYAICTQSKMAMVSITLPICKDLQDELWRHKDFEKRGKRCFLVYHFLTDDLWSLRVQAVRELNRLRNDRDQARIAVLKFKIDLRSLPY